MRQRLVDVEKLYTFRLVVQLYRLQTWDVSEKWRSGQAAEYQDLIVFICQLANVDRVTKIIVNRNIREWFADLGRIGLKLRHARWPGLRERRVQPESKQQAD